MKLSYSLTKEAKESGVAFCVPRAGDAGFDLPALCDVSISSGGLVKISTGLILAIPEGHVGLLRDRSSVALRGGLVVAGVVDSSYRGEVLVAMRNLSGGELRFSAGDRVAQCLILPFWTCDSLREVASPQMLGSSARGEGGFGSTGS